jgi:hypothetical protein
MRLCIALCLGLTLAACASPRQRCLAAATGDLRVVDRLITETEANLERGFAVEHEPYVTTGVDLCAGTALHGGGRLHVAVGSGLTLCNTVETRTRSRPVAIDPAAEQRKLTQLRATRDRLSHEAAARAAACPPA